GLEYERDRFNWHFNGLSITNLQFNTFQDFLIGLPGGCGVSVAGVCNGTTQSNIANTGVSASVTPAGGLVHYYRNAAASAFVQDDYKVMSNLTLNLGLRWEYNGQITDANGNLTNVWPNLINAVPVPGATRATGTLAGFVVPSNYNPSLYPAPPVSGIFQNDKPLMTAADPTLKNFAPRVGFAWKPLASDRFVIRGGGGYFYDRLGQSSFNKPSVQAQPYSITLSKSGTANAASSFSTPYDPTVTVGWQPRFQSLTTPATNSGLNILLLDPNYKNPVTYQWNLNVQYEFLPKWVLELGYVGSRGLHLVPETTIGETQLNGARIASPTNPIVIPGLATPITTNTAANIPLRVPYLGFVPTGVQADLTNGDSKYSSLQLTVRKQLSHGFSMQAAYSFSRSFNTAGYNGVFTTSGTPYGPNIQYRPHRLAINYSYELPFGTHEGLLGKVTSGWTVAGVTVVQSGLPLTITDSRGGGVYGYSNSSTSTSVAQFVPGKGNADVPTTGDIFTRLGGNFGGVGYLDKNAFGTTPIAANSPDNLTLFGNAGYGIVYGPGQANFDATIQKTTRVGGLREDANLVFRTEFFNVFNHTQFLAPGTLDVSNANFGRITSTAVNPRLIQFALKYVF
ncbi:MAG TPA: hypothetical protein VG892_00245, partial [Terriglobales bacterium]|nr:hypothetical protein [Terriglobales bacterium]